MRRISCLIIAAISLLVGCSTPYEYVYVYPDPVQLPGLDSVISPALREELEREPDLIYEPETVGDILHNMQEYQAAYIVQLKYSHALEDYIEEIIAIHNDGGIKEGT